MWGYYSREDTNWADKFWGIWGIFCRTISTHFGTELVVFSNFFCFSDLTRIYPKYDIGRNLFEK